MAREHREQQKLDECRFVAGAARLMDVQWKLAPRLDESKGGPDFIVHEGAHTFGLEVQKVFKGSSSQNRGSALKRDQSETQRRIDRMRQQYEDVAENIPLYVKFLDSPDEDRIDRIIDELRNMNLREKDFPYHEDFVVDQDSGPLKIFVSRLPDGWGRDRLSRPDWFSVADAGGWVEKGPQKILEAIAEKSKKVLRYRENVAADLRLKNPQDADIRLMLIADHMWGFGQVDICDDAAGDLGGFNEVYFFSFPEKVTLLTQTDPPAN